MGEGRPLGVRVPERKPNAEVRGDGEEGIRRSKVLPITHHQIPPAMSPAPPGIPGYFGGS